MEHSFEKSRVNFIGKTLLTMGFGLLITFVMAFLTPILFPEISYSILVGAMIAELVLVIYLSRRIQKLSVSSARIFFLVYALLNGFTLSIIFSSYNLSQVSSVFLATSATFFCSAMIGMTTKKDLSRFGQFLIMAVIGLLIMSILQMFLPLQGLNFAISLVGILIFSGLTAYDMQKVKMLHAQTFSINPQDTQKFVIIAALGLYLDFINLFLYFLRLLKD
jgi:FtsH-binding integral membrane protein